MERKHIYIVCALVIVLALMLAAVLYIRLVKNAEPSAIDTLLEASSVALVDPQGNPVDLATYDETVRIINSWATWSPFSPEELVALNTLAGEYKDRGVVVLAINRNEPKERIEAFLSTLPPLPNITFIRDTADLLYAASAGYTMPETLFYSRDGELIFHKRGALTLDELRMQTESALTVPQ